MTVASLQAERDQAWAAFAQAAGLGSSSSRIREAAKDAFEAGWVEGGLASLQRFETAAEGGDPR